MDRPRETNQFGISASPNPTPPLALSDLLAQRPFPPYTPPYERPVASPDTTFAEADGQSMQAVASGYETQASPNLPEQEIQVPTPPTPVLTTQPAPIPQPPAISTADWQAKRNQLRPSKNQGSKADWIRGWSEGVGVYGSETYCACSASSPIEDSSFSIKGGEVKTGVASIFRGKRAATVTVNDSSSPVTTTTEADVCRNCSRMPSPPTSAATSVKSDGVEVAPKTGLIKRFNDLLDRVQRAKPGRRKDSNGRNGTLRTDRNSGETPVIHGPSGKTQSDTSKPQRTQTLDQVRTNPDSKQYLAGDRSARATSLDAKRASTMLQTAGAMDGIDNAGAHLTALPGRGVEPGTHSPTPIESISDSDSDKPRGGDALEKSRGRLERAAELLQRSGQQKRNA